MSKLVRCLAALAVGLGILTQATIARAEDRIMPALPVGFCDNFTSTGCNGGPNYQAEIKGYVGLSFNSGPIFGPCWHVYNWGTNQVKWVHANTQQVNWVNVATGTLPPGLQISNNMIQGVPERAGDYYLSVNFGIVCDGLPAYGQPGQQLHFTIVGSSVPKSVQ